MLFDNMEIMVAGVQTNFHNLQTQEMTPTPP